MENPIKLAIPNKGALSEGAVKLLGEAGYRCFRSGRELIVADNANGIDFVFLRPRDIALYVGRGILDLGITGRDLAADSGAGVAELLPLGFGKSRFCFAAPAAKKLRVEELNDLRIATSYPQLLDAMLKERNLKCQIVKLDGAVEISIRLGVADAIADVVESGTTMRQAGLAPIGDPVMLSEAILIARSAEAEQQPQTQTFLKRVRGILTARDYVVVEYDITSDRLEAACAITPGLESPTIMPLSKPGWHAVKAMVRRGDLNPVVDRLEEIGANCIIVTDIKTCRI